MCQVCQFLSFVTKIIGLFIIGIELWVMQFLSAKKKENFWLFPKSRRCRKVKFYFRKEYQIHINITVFVHSTDLPEELLWRPIRMVHLRERASDVLLHKCFRSRKEREFLPRNRFVNSNAWRYIYESCVHEERRRDVLFQSCKLKRKS